MKKLLLLFALLLAEKMIAQVGVWRDQTTRKVGVSNPMTHEPITPAEFDEASFHYLCDTLVFVKKEGLEGILSTTGRTVLPLGLFQFSYPFESGLEHGFLAVKKDGPSGLWSISESRLVAPMDFEFLRGLEPDLIAARRKGGEIIEFFNQKGQKLFETAGNSVVSGFDKKTLTIINTAQKRRLIDRKGRPFFDEKIKGPRWTDGEFIIVTDMARYSALLTARGDTILSAFVGSVAPIGKGRFIINRVERTSKSGVFDAKKGIWTIPLSHQSITKKGSEGDTLSLLAVHSSQIKPSVFYHHNGKIALDSALSSGYFLNDMLAARQYGSDYRHDAYFAATKKGDPKATGFFANDGRQIAPFHFEQFFYRSEKHAVIARGSAPHFWNAFDLKTGQKLFKVGFEELQFTEFFQGFWAKKNKKWGFVKLGEEGLARFEFDFIQTLMTGSFAVKTGEKWRLANSNCELVGDAFFDNILSPTTEQFLKFHEKGGEKGQLLAVGRLGSDFFSITQMGLSRFLEKVPNEELTFLYPEKSADASKKEGIDEPQPNRETSDKLVENEPMEMKEPPPPELIEKPEVFLAEQLEPLDFVDKMPEFPGGEAALFAFLKANLIYPELAKASKEQGRVIVTFIVEKDGSLTAPKVLKGGCVGCGKETLRLVGLMPKWTAGEQNGKPVRVQYNLPVVFKLD